MSPTERSLKHLRQLGYVAAVVEKWNAHARIRQDAFGILDIIALTPDGETIGVQTTSGSNVSARVKKITEHPSLVALRKCGWRVIVQGWRKGANGRYVLREVDLS